MYTGTAEQATDVHWHGRVRNWKLATDVHWHCGASHEKQATDVHWHCRVTTRSKPHMCIGTAERATDVHWHGVMCLSTSTANHGERATDVHWHGCDSSS